MVAMPGMDDMKDGWPFFVNELNAVYADGDARLEGAARINTECPDPRLANRSTPIGDRGWRRSSAGCEDWPPQL